MHMSDLEVHDHHTHGHHTHDHDHTHGGTPLEELLMLMKYMVSHNDAHAQELAELASQLKEAGKERAYRRIMDAVAEFDIANAKLDSVCKELSEEND